MNSEDRLMNTRILKSNLKPLAGGVLIGALLAGIVATNAVALPQAAEAAAAEAPAGEAPVAGTPVAGQPPGGPKSFSDLVDQVKPAVVNISIQGTTQMPERAWPRQEFRQGSPFDEFFREFFEGRPGMRSPGNRPGAQFRAVGSGFIISADGYVVTNNHVIERAEEIEIILNNGERHAATVQGRDPKTDLALLKVNADKPLPYVELGDSDQARVGDWVLAVGNPFGLGGSVTAGIISARGRDIQAGPFDDFLQVDAPINRGNSGGPLFDSTGQVIGINTAIYSPSGGSVGIGFAIPAAMASDIVEQLKSSGAVERGWLGVQFQPVNDAVAASLGLDEAIGALVADVVEDSPASKAGLQTGDVIISVAGKDLDEAKDLPRIIAAARAGSELEMQILRAGKVRNVDVEIGRSEQDVVAAAEAPARSPDGLGMRLAPLDERARARFGIPEDSAGVLVTGVARNTPAARAGIRTGQLITMVGQQPIDSPADLVEAISEASDAGRESVLLLVEQRGARQFVAVELNA